MLRAKIRRHLLRKTCLGIGDVYSNESRPEVLNNPVEIRRFQTAVRIESRIMTTFLENRGDHRNSLLNPERFEVRRRYRIY
ncbi:MAG: hypothetical protein QGI24_07160 [Kiritimatiellia bacterium]|nr:hypothetical protein [Kiritimatiellia bacterium]